MSIDPAWTELLGAARGSAGGASIYVFGETDTGKTTLARFLVESLGADRRVAWIDADPGQSEVGPPSCVSAAWAGSEEPLALRFVGDVSPSGHLLQTLTGVVRLVEQVRAGGAEMVVIDSSGFVCGDAARELQYQLIDLLRPSHLVALQRGDELAPLLSAFDRRAGIACRGLSAASSVRRRSPSERAARREEKFREYFAAARRLELELAALGLHGRVPPLDAPDRWRGRLVGLVGRDGFAVALGVIERLESPDRLHLLAPPLSAANLASVHVGSLAFRIDGFPTSVSIERKG